MLIDLLLDATLGRGSAPDRLELALFHGTKEITANGYRRGVVAKGEWRIRNGQVETTVRYVFTSPATFDRAVLFRGQEIVDDANLAAPFTVGPSTYEHTFVATFEKV